MRVSEGKIITQSHTNTEQQNFISSRIALKVRNIWCGWSPRRTEKQHIYIISAILIEGKKCTVSKLRQLIFDSKQLNILSVWRAPFHFCHSPSCLSLIIMALGFPGGCLLHGSQNPSFALQREFSPPKSKMNRHFTNVSGKVGNSSL